MKKLLVIFVSAFALASLHGCATSNYSYGRDFNSENVKLIVKGVTTTTELEQLIGMPFSKTLINETDEKWLYMYSNGTSKAQSYVFTMNVETTGRQKMLDVLIRKGVVLNYTYTSGGTPLRYNVESGR